jgi:hypothetical protein
MLVRHIVDAEAFPLNVDIIYSSDDGLIWAETCKEALKYSNT